MIGLGTTVDRAIGRLAESIGAVAIEGRQMSRSAIKLAAGMCVGGIVVAAVVLPLCEAVLIRSGTIEAPVTERGLEAAMDRVAGGEIVRVSEPSAAFLSVLLGCAVRPGARMKVSGWVGEEISAVSVVDTGDYRGISMPFGGSRFVECRTHSSMLVEPSTRIDVGQVLALGDAVARARDDYLHPPAIGTDNGQVEAIWSVSQGPRPLNSEGVTVYPECVLSSGVCGPYSDEQPAVGPQSTDGETVKPMPMPDAAESGSTPEFEQEVEPLETQPMAHLMQPPTHPFTSQPELIPEPVPVTRPESRRIEKSRDAEVPSQVSRSPELGTEHPVR